MYARYMEAFAAYLSHTDHEIGRLFARLEAMGELDNTIVVVLSDNGASSEGGLDGFAQRRARVERAAAHRRRGRRAARRDRRPAHPQQLSVGLDRRRQHAVSAVEARDARGRRRRSADRGLAPRHRGARRGAHASTCTPSTSCRRCSTRSASRRPTRSTASRSRRRSPTPPRLRPTPRSTTRCSAAGRCTRTGGRPSPITRSSSTSPASTRRRGSSTTCAPIRRSATTSPPPSPIDCKR